MRRSLLPILFLASFSMACQQAGFRALRAIPQLRCETGAGSTLGACVTLDFGDVPVGISTSKTVVLANTGKARLTVASSAWSADSSAALTSLFALDSVEANTERSFVVSFAPTTLGSAHGTFTVKFQGGYPDESIAVTGNGVGHPSLEVSPTTLVFSALPPNTTATQTVTLTNAGNAPLEITSAALSPTSSPVFSLVEAPSFPLTLAPAEHRELTVNYNTHGILDANDRSGELVIASNDPATPSVTVPINGSGSGHANLKVTPASVAFGAVAPNTTAMRTVTLSNEGDITLQISTAGLSRTSSTAFTLDGAPTFPLALAPAAHQDLTISYDTTALLDAELRSGELVIASNDPITPSVSVPLTGTCPGCAISTPDPGCDMTYPHRVWPVAADVPNCNRGSGPEPTTGANSVNWTSWAGCGVQRDFAITPGHELRIATWGDGCACGGCQIWHINYLLQEDTGSGFQTEIHIAQPDTQQCPATGGAHDESAYTPQTSLVRMIAQQGSSGIGYYFAACSN
jgi:hypothetical protein